MEEQIHVEMVEQRLVNRMSTQGMRGPGGSCGVGAYGVGAKEGPCETEQGQGRGVVPTDKFLCFGLQKSISFPGNTSKA